MDGNRANEEWECNLLEVDFVSMPPSSKAR